jgi:hypothetical protein
MTTTPDPDQLLALLRDPHVESQEIAAQVGVPREEAGRAARLLMALPKAKPEEVVTLPPPLAVALARAALAAGRVDLLGALAGHAGKDVAKEAKRALHLLRARGVEVPEASRLVAPPALAPVADPGLPALASAVDGRGERVVWLPRAQPGKGIEVGQAVLSDERGLTELRVGMLGRKEWRGFVKDLLERGARMGVMEVPRRHAHAWITAGRALNERTGQRVPDGADFWLHALGPAEAPPDPAAALPPLPPDEEREALLRSDKLHDLPLLAPWLAEEDYLKTVAARLDEVQVSPLYIDEGQRAAQVERVLSVAAADYLDDARRGRLASRLLSVAAHLASRGDAAHAQAAAAAARALASGAPAESIPFARGLVFKAFPPQPSVPPRPSVPEGGSGLIVAPR